MYSVKVLLLLSAILPTQSEMHSLYYTYTAMSRPGNKYEFYTSVELNDLQMSLCNRVNKAKFMTQFCEESKRLFNESDDLRYKQQWLQINLKTLMEQRKENSSWHTDLHVLQWRHGCAVERLSNGSVMLLRATDEYAYDGQTLTFDPSTHWMLSVFDIVWNRESVSSVERKCVETLTSFTDLQREGKFIMESPPRVHALVKESGSSMELLVCLATGFYPKHVQMEIRRNRRPLPDEQLNSDGIRPNADGSFQLRKSLEILPCETSWYQCVVKDQRDGTEIWKDFCTDASCHLLVESDSTISSLWIQDAVIGCVVCILIVFPIILLTFYPLRQYGKHPSEYHSNPLKSLKYGQKRKCLLMLNISEEQDTLKTPSLLQLSDIHKTQMEPDLLEEIRAERCAGLAAALNEPDDENPADPTEEVHDTQSLRDTKATPAASRGSMGSKIISLPNFAMEREDTDQNAITQNALLLPLPRRCRSKEISLPNLAEDRQDSSDSS